MKTFNLHLHLGNLADAVSKASYDKYIIQEEKQQIAVGTVRVFIWSKFQALTIAWLTHSLVDNKDS